MDQEHEIERVEYVADEYEPLVYDLYHGSGWFSYVVLPQGASDGNR